MHFSKTVLFSEKRGLPLGVILCTIAYMGVAVNFYFQF